MHQKRFTAVFLIFLSACGVDPDRRATSQATTFPQGTDTLDKKQKVAPATIGVCGYDNNVSTLGQGLILPPSKFEIFNDSLLSDKYSTIDLYADEGTQADICSKYFQPDYGIMYFVCLGITNHSYKILINYSESKFLPKTAAYKFQSWEDYILHSFGLRRSTQATGKTGLTQPLRKSNTDTADSLTIPQGYELFCPLDVQGDWIKVTYDCFYNQEVPAFEGEACHTYIEKCQDPLTGWLKWRQDNKILVDIFLMP